MLYCDCIASAMQRKRSAFSSQKRERIEMSNDNFVRARVKHAQSQCVYLDARDVNERDLLSLTRADLLDINQVVLAHTCRVCQNDAVNVVFHATEKFFYEYFTCSDCLRAHKKSLSSAYTASADFLNDAVNVTYFYLDSNDREVEIEKSVKCRCVVIDSTEHKALLKRVNRK